MPDTGAPWNLPYPAPSGLVRDAPVAFEDLAVAVAAGLDDASLIRQVVQTVKTDTFTTSSSSFVTLTGMSASITPSSTSSLVLVLVDLNLSPDTASGSGVNTAQVRITGGNAESYVGDAAGSRSRVAGSVTSVSGLSNLRTTTHVGLIYLDSPGVATSVSYGLEIKTGVAGRTVVVNRTFNDADSSIEPRTPSSITLIEVAA